MSAAMIEAARVRHPYRLTESLDHKAWAKQIMYRVELRDPSLLPVQIQFAKMALDIKEEVAA